MELILLWSSLHFSVALHDRVLLECGTEQCGVGGVISCYVALMSSAMWCSPKKIFFGCKRYVSYSLLRSVVRAIAKISPTV